MSHKIGWLRLDLNQQTRSNESDTSTRHGRVDCLGQNRIYCEKYKYSVLGVMVSLVGKVVV